MPSKPITPVIELIAHRGARTLAKRGEIAPENTMAAFSQAAALGAGIELDVMATRDRVVVVHHDEATGRVFTLPHEEKPLQALTYRELQAAVVNQQGHEREIQGLVGDPTYRMNPVFATEKIPTLEQVLAAFPKTPLYLELKTQSARDAQNHGLEKGVLSLIQQYKAFDRVTVISFWPWSLLKIKAMAPQLKTGLDYTHAKGFNMVTEQLFFALAKGILRVKALHPPYQEVTPRLVAHAHRWGLKVIPWVAHQTRAEEPAWVSKLFAMGVDGVMSNAVDLLDSREGEGRI